MSLFDLWLPILIAAVFVFVVSSVIHMATPMHKSDYARLPNEDDVRTAIRGSGVVPGQYVFPCGASMADMNSEAMLAKLREGPVGFMVVMPNGSFRLGRSLMQWFAFSLVIAAMVGYIASMHFGQAVAEPSAVFRMTATIGVLGFGVSTMHQSIWSGLRWTTSCRFLIDGVLYGLATGAAFTWFWPGA